MEQLFQNLGVFLYIVKTPIGSQAGGVNAKNPDFLKDGDRVINMFLVLFVMISIN